MYRYNCFCPVGYRSLYQFGINIVFVIDIDEDRFGPGNGDYRGRGDKAVWRGNNFITGTYVQGFQDEEKGISPGVKAYGVLGIT